MERWQAARGLPATGQILLGDVVFEPGPIRVTSVTPSVGTPVGGSGADGASGGGGVGGGGTVLTATGTTPVVSVDLPVTQEYLVKPGDAVSVVLPDGTTTVGGRVQSVGTVATCPGGGGTGTGGSGSADQSPCSSAGSNGGGGSNSSPTVTVTITLDAVPRGAALDQVMADEPTGNLDTTTGASILELLRELHADGTTIVVITRGRDVAGAMNRPDTADGMVSRIGPVTGVAGIASISSDYVYRTPFIPAIQTSGIALTAADPALKATLGITVAHGAFLNAATARYPAVVLGSEAAGLLGIYNLAHPTQVWIGGHWFTVVGILSPIELQSTMDSMAFIGFPVAQQYFGFDGNPTELFVRSDFSQVNAVAAVLPATVNPADPATVLVAEESGIIQAEVVTRGAYNTLFLGLGAIALLVGGVGIANVMVISVLERRSEIGLRRALGATRRHVGEQFLAEAVLLSVLGGLAGTVIGVAATVIYARTQHWQVLIPPLALYGGIGAALAIGAIAGLYPAMRAARLSPTEALRTV